VSLSRREFLKIISASAIIASAPAFSNSRKPYVTINSNPVSFIGSSNAFQGSKIVEKVLPFDGVGYPVLLKSQSSVCASQLYYDFDLVDMITELPDNFWHNKENKEKYPNVHTYLREQRFEESVWDAILHMQHGRPLPVNWYRFKPKT